MNKKAKGNRSEYKTMKTKSEKVLPKTMSQITNGGVYAQRVRCGKSNCKCARGETHTGFYFYTRRNGKLIKFYIRKAEVAGFSRLVKQATTEARARRQSAKDSVELLKTFRVSLMDNDGLIKTLREEQNNGENNQA